MRIILNRVSSVKDEVQEARKDGRRRDTSKILTCNEWTSFSSVDVLRSKLCEVTERREKQKEQARDEEIQQEEETIALGQLTVGKTKKYPRINPRRSPSLRLEYPFAYGLLRIEKFPAYRGTFFKYSNGSTASSCYTRDIASLRNPLFAEASPMRRSMFFTRNFRNCRFPDMPCFTEIRPCHTGYANWY